MGLSGSSSESPIGEIVFLSESDVEELEPVRCLLLSSLGLVDRNDHISGNAWRRREKGTHQVPGEVEN